MTGPARLPPSRSVATVRASSPSVGRVTPALAAAFADPVVAAAPAWELIALGLIVVLMVAKAF